MSFPRSNSSNAITAKRQHGVAIITALLIVTIAATVSITISTRLQLDVRRTSNLIAQDQAHFYMLAAEEWTQRILRQDKKDSKIDSLDEDWAIALPPLPVDGGSIQGTLTDLHACLNVNSLVKGEKIDSTTKTRLAQLFNNQGVKNDLTQAIADWIDTDLETSNPNGAEDGYYLNLEKPYRTANTPLHSISELRLIKGLNEKPDTQDKTAYQLVEPYLCAFVASDSALSINVNTASNEVLQSLAAGMTDALVEDIIQHREETPFNDIANFTSFSNVKTIITNIEQLSVSSNYFLLRSQAKIGNANNIMYSIIYRDDEGKTAIIARTQRTL